MLYNNLSEYFRKKYGQRIKKICVDGGFSCPNRDGKCGTGGCIYCGERGAGEHIRKTESIKEQVKSALENASDSDKFLVYFQNFSNTYAELETLKARYDEALIDGRIVALAIATRPDCINDEIASLIAEYSERLDVWVELGLQTSNDNTAKVINRGYSTEVFDKAVRVLHKYSIPVVPHMIIGLPGETQEDAIETARHISSLGVFGIKIHSIYVMEGTALADMYREKRYTPPTLEEFTVAAALCLGNISNKIIVHRLTGDCPKELLIAPEWNRDKYKVLEEITTKMEELGIRQGSLSK